MAAPSTEGPRHRLRSLRRQLISDIRWHIDEAANALGRAGDRKPVPAGAGKPVPTMDYMRWHIDAAKEDLERAAGAGPMRWLKDHTGVIAFFSLLVALTTFLTTSIVTWSDTNAENGRLHDKVTTLQGQLTDASNSNRAMNSLVNDQLEKGNISLQTVLQYLTLTPKQRLTFTRQVLVITSPARSSVNKPAVVPSVITVRGTINTPLNGRNIWILISTPGINRVYPQGSFRDNAGPAILDANHQWVSPTVLVGGPRDKGRHFDIIAVLADSQASGAFWQYLKAGAAHNKFPGKTGLPQGATEYDRVEVQRG